MSVLENLNSELIEGKVVSDVILYRADDGVMPQCDFVLECDCGNVYKGNGKFGNELYRFEVTAFGRVAETCHEKIPEGSFVRVVGHIEQRSWEYAKGVMHKRVVIVAEHIEFKES